ncbi:MAG: hypothetical protein LBU51_08310 [Bacteroidales bacterium]|jgi:hypothetical protein|nr:hypothetical protein [Bacteroidales bacterium]
MNKIGFVLIVLCCILNFCSAQDTIVTNQSEKIVAKILEVSADEIRYKKIDFQDGPTYVVKKSTLTSIIYSNGSIEVIEQTHNNPKRQYYQGEKEDGFYSLNKYYLKGIPVMNGREYEKFLKSSCPRAYQQYRVGKNLFTTGIVSISLGSALAIGGMVCMIVGDNISNEAFNSISSNWNVDFNNFQNSWEASITAMDNAWNRSMYGDRIYEIGIGLLSAGGVLLNISIPFLISGAVIKHNTSIHTYNRCRFYNTNTSLNLHVRSNGIGFAIHF